MRHQFKTLYKNLQKELFIIHKKLHKVQTLKDLEKQKALLQYQKLQLIRERKPTHHIEERLAKLDKGEVEVPPMDTTLLKKIVNESELEDGHFAKIKLSHLDNIAKFLNSQRTYIELIERYNPGLTMSQEDKVRRTANRVGLSVPEN